MIWVVSQGCAPFFSEFLRFRFEFVYSQIGLELREWFTITQVLTWSLYEPNVGISENNKNFDESGSVRKLF